MVALPAIPKWAIAVLVAAAVVAVYLHSTPASGEWEDGAPEMSVHFDIRKVGEAQLTLTTNDVDIKPVSQLDDMLSISPLTAFTATIDPLDPDAIYEITMTVSVLVRASSSEERGTFDLTLLANAQQTEAAGIRYYYSGLSYYLTAAGYAEHGVQSALTLPTWDTTKLNVAGESMVPITGMDIDGMVVELTAEAVSSLGNEASTTATVTMEVEPGGINVTITGIETTVG